MEKCPAWNFLRRVTAKRRPMRRPMAHGKVCAPLLWARSRLPVTIGAGAVMPCASKRWEPNQISGSSYYFGSNFNVILPRRKGLQDGADLRRMDAPHAGVSQLTRCPGSSVLHGGGIRKLGDHAVRRHLAVGMTGRSDLQLGTHHQRVRKLPFRVMPCAGMAPPWADTKSMSPNSTLHARVRAISNARCTRCRRLDQYVVGNWAAEARSSGALYLQHIVYRLHLGTMRWHSLWPARPQSWRHRWRTRMAHAWTRAATRALALRSTPGPPPNGRVFFEPTGAPSSQSSVTSKTQVPNLESFRPANCRLAHACSTPL